MVSYLCALHVDYSVSDQARQFPSTRWSEVGHGGLELEKVEKMLWQSCGAVEAGVMKSATTFERAGTECFGGLNLESGC